MLLAFDLDELSYGISNPNAEAEIGINGDEGYFVRLYGLRVEILELKFAKAPVSSAESSSGGGNDEANFDGRFHEEDRMVPV